MPEAARLIRIGDSDAKGGAPKGARVFGLARTRV
jgi:hypothetical protein